MGSMIMEKEILSGTSHEFTLADQKTGIYLIRVVQNGEIGIKKSSDSFHKKHLNISCKHPGPQTG